MSKRKNLIIIGVVGVAFILFIIYIYLPYARTADKQNVVTQSLEPSQMLKAPVKKVPPFSLTDQNGHTITNADVQGKVYVADFFYASCRSSCPMLTEHLGKVQASINKSAPFRILSYSVDPVHDSVPVLKAYAEKNHAIDSIWHFLTGPRDSIYRLGIEGYLQSVLQSDTSRTVNHSEKLILVDKQGNIRGFYDGLNENDIQSLIEDINYLAYRE